MNNKKDKIEKYMNRYMRIGILFGILSVLIFDTIFSPDNIFSWSGFGMAIAMCIGMAIGKAKDKRLSENIMIIIKIETTKDTTDVVIYVSNKYGIKKKYRVTKEKMKEEKFAEGDRVAEEANDSLVSLESK